MKIPFNQFYLTGNELSYIHQALQSDRLSGDGEFTKKCHRFFEERYGFQKSYLTTSCTHSLEMAALLAAVQPGDEVIMPSYTFVSTANAFMLRGANIVFADSGMHNPNLDVQKLEQYISRKTKVIVVVHYAGIAVDMDPILEIAHENNIIVIEDAAQGINAFYKDKPLGGIGNLGCFSFHDTKNITCGEGGLLTINDPAFVKRAEIIREKGTNRAAFYRGEVDKYGWVDIGSSYLPSDVLAAFLYAQLQQIEFIHQERLKRWNNYFVALKELSEKGFFELPHVPDYARHNGHIFYLVCRSGEERDDLMQYLRAKNIQAPFHYLSLHQSKYFKNHYNGKVLSNADRYTDCLIRIPLYLALREPEQAKVIEEIKCFFSR